MVFNGVGLGKSWLLLLWHPHWLYVGLVCGVQGDAAFDPVGAAGQTLLYFRSQFTTSDDGLATREALNMNTPFLDGSMVRSAVQCGRLRLEVLPVNRARPNSRWLSCSRRQPLRVPYSPNSMDLLLTLWGGGRQAVWCP